MTRPGTWWETLRAFARLGVVSFGGPIAHLGYFRTEFVERRRWLRDDEYADLVAMSQFLPGPASSQVGFGIGLQRAGLAGALAAFAAFTLPSAALMVAFAYGVSFFDSGLGAGVLTGLKIVAVAIVAHAVWGMAQTLTPDRARVAIAISATVVVLVVAAPIAQVGVIALGALAGLVLCRRTEPVAPRTPPPFAVPRALAVTCLAVFALALVALPLVSRLLRSDALALFAAFYQAGALVFGGGHVVLPLLEAGVVAPGWVSESEFLAGYAAAQAVPGPMFTFAAYLGVLSTVGPGGVAGAALALAGIFLPGLLLVVGIMPFWNALRARSWARALLRGAGAAVVGILLAALYDPVFLTAITDTGAFLLALVAFVLLAVFRLPPWSVVLVGAAGGMLLSLWT